MNRSMDLFVFAHRNKAYGAFYLRQVYSKHMTIAMLSGILFFLLAVNMPRILILLQGVMPVTEELVYKEVELADVPILDKALPPLPPKPKIAAPIPPVRDMVRFVPPAVKKDDEVENEEETPSIIELVDKDPGTETIEKDSIVTDAAIFDPPIAVEPGGGSEPADEDIIHKFVEQQPSFPDGDQAMFNYLYKHIRYPAIARENNIEGSVVIRFVVGKDGQIRDAQILRGIGGGCEEEALRVVRQMPLWNPGKQNGNPVSVIFTLPLQFNLE